MVWLLAPRTTPNLKGVVFVSGLLPQTSPAWLDLPGTLGSRRHSFGDRKVTQASAPRQGTTPRGTLNAELKTIRMSSEEAKQIALDRG